MLSSSAHVFLTSRLADEGLSWSTRQPRITCRHAVMVRSPEDRRLFSPAVTQPVDRQHVETLAKTPAILLLEPRLIYQLVLLCDLLLGRPGQIWRFSSGPVCPRAHFPACLGGERTIVVYISRKFTPLLLFNGSQRVLYIKHKVILPHILTVFNSLNPGWDPPPRPPFWLLFSADSYLHVSFVKQKESDSV